MDLRHLQHLRQNPFIANADFLKLLNIVVNISIIRGCKSLRSVFVNSILFYHTKAIFIFECLNFNRNTLRQNVFFDLLETYLMAKIIVSKFVFSYFYILLVPVLLKKYIYFSMMLNP